MTSSIVNTAIPRRQRGVVLFIALIVLVAMTLAGIAMMRSVDTATVVAGNLGFKQASLQFADQGVDQAFRWLLNNNNGGTLQADSATNGYQSFVGANDPNWFDSGYWTSFGKCIGCTADTASGGTQQSVQYVVHRMCNCSGSHSDICAGTTNTNQCASLPQTAAGVGGSMRVGASQYTLNPSLYYRITARVTGPNNTVSIVQAMAVLSQ